MLSLRPELHLGSLLPSWISLSAFSTKVSFNVIKNNNKVITGRRHSIGSKEPKYFCTIFYHHYLFFDLP